MIYIKEYYKYLFVLLVSFFLVFIMADAKTAITTFEEYISKIGGQSNLPTELDIIEPWENESFKERFINRFLYREIGMDIRVNEAEETNDIKKYTHRLMIFKYL